MPIPIARLAKEEPVNLAQTDALSAQLINSSILFQ
jgi:hypothetical protein